MVRLSGVENAKQNVQQRVARVKTAHEMGWTNYEIATMLNLPENLVREILSEKETT